MLTSITEKKKKNEQSRFPDLWHRTHASTVHIRVLLSAVVSSFIW